MNLNGGKKLENEDENQVFPMNNNSSHPKHDLLSILAKRHYKPKPISRIREISSVHKGFNDDTQHVMAYKISPKDKSTQIKSRLK